jgi:hypothetical protein
LSHDSERELVLLRLVDADHEPVLAERRQGKARHADGERDRLLFADFECRWSTDVELHLGDERLTGCRACRDRDTVAVCVDRFDEKCLVLVGLGPGDLDNDPEVKVHNRTAPAHQVARRCG